MTLSRIPLLTALPLAATVALTGALTIATTPAPNGAEPVLSGAYQRAYEDAFTDNIPFSDGARAAYTALTLALFNQAGPEVVLAGDWVFTAEEFRAPESAPDLRATLIETRDRLAVHGITLIPLIVPDKARIYGPLLPRPRDPALQGRYQDALAVLRDLGFPAADLSAALDPAQMGRDSFMRTDTHWSPLGAERAARAVARAAGLGAQDNTQFTTTWAGPVGFDGDLRPFVETGAFAPWIGPTPEEITIPTTQANSDGLGLFDEVAIDAVLVGTSFSARTEFNFAGFLQQQTGLSLVNLAVEGRGPFAPMQEALDSGAITDLTPTFVFWEIPERYILPRSFP